MARPQQIERLRVELAPRYELERAEARVAALPESSAAAAARLLYPVPSLRPALLGWMRTLLGETATESAELLSPPHPELVDYLVDAFVHTDEIASSFASITDGRLASAPSAIVAEAQSMRAALAEQRGVLASTLSPAQQLERVRTLDVRSRRFAFHERVERTLSELAAAPGVWDEVWALLTRALDRETPGERAAQDQDRGLGEAMREAFLDAGDVPPELREADRALSDDKSLLEALGQDLLGAALAPGALPHEVVPGPLSAFVRATSECDRRAIELLGRLDLSPDVLDQLPALHDFGGAVRRQRLLRERGPTAGVLDATAALARTFLLHRLGGITGGQVHRGTSERLPTWLPGYFTGAREPEQRELEANLALLDDCIESGEGAPVMAVPSDALKPSAWRLGGWLRWRWLSPAEVESKPYSRAKSLRLTRLGSGEAHLAQTFPLQRKPSWLPEKAPHAGGPPHVVVDYLRALATRLGADPVFRDVDGQALAYARDRLTEALDAAGPSLRYGTDETWLRVLVAALDSWHASVRGRYSESAELPAAAGDEAASALAESLVRFEPGWAAAWVAHGALHSRAGRIGEAAEAFEAALLAMELARNWGDGGEPPARAFGDEQAWVASCGRSAARLALGDLDGAADDLAYASELDLPDDRRGLLSRIYGLGSPGSLSSQLGRGFVRERRFDRVVELIGLGGLRAACAEEARKLRVQSVAAYDAGNLEAARTAALEAVKLVPADPDVAENLGIIAYDLSRYREAIGAFRAAAARRPLRDSNDLSFALAHATLGDYEQALKVLPLVGDPEHATAQWRVVIAYGAGGTDEALTSWRACHPDFAPLSDEPSVAWDVFELIQGGARDLAERSERITMRYATIVHRALAFRALGELSLHVRLTGEDEQWVRRRRAEDFAALAAAYRTLEGKPLPPQEAVALAVEGAAAVDRDDLWAATGAYAQAREAAPWWPDVHYNLAFAGVADLVWLPGALDAARDYFALVPAAPETAESGSRLRRLWSGEDDDPARLLLERLPEWEGAWRELQARGARSGGPIVGLAEIRYG